jgi:hypothetical protein
LYLRSIRNVKEVLPETAIRRWKNMAKIRDPLQFSRHFNVSEKQLAKVGVLDPTLNVDTKLFIDPLLLGKSSHSEIRKAEKTYKDFFKLIIKLLIKSRNEDDVAWRAAYGRLKFGEIKGTCLGYGASSIRGSGFGRGLTKRITKTAKEIVDLGINDPDLFTVLPLLEEGVGPDLISDMTTHIIINDLARFNSKIAKKLKLSTEEFIIDGNAVHFIKNPKERGRTPVILLPTDILRNLPTAKDWDEVCDVARKNAELRNRVNKLIAEIWKAKTKKFKLEIRKKALSKKEAFELLLETIRKAQPLAYDVGEDPEGLLVWRRIHSAIASQHPLALHLTSNPSIDDVFDLVKKIIEQFKYLIEKRGLWKELWHNGKRRNEKSVQRIFYAVADSYCKANDIDISPEVDTGTGEIDFKFSSGYSKRVLVEVKLSDSTKLLAGYNKQLEIYKESEQTNKGVYVVVDVGHLAKKERELHNLQSQRVKKSLPISEIVLIDRKRQKSASKR